MAAFPVRSQSYNLCPDNFAAILSFCPDDVAGVCQTFAKILVMWFHQLRVMSVDGNDHSHKSSRMGKILRALAFL